ncbi:MAG: hypothetical protein ACJATF_001644 [Flavobacteriales bacterium]|jgi:hypothetical protein
MTDLPILLFYGWWQLTVCLFAFLALMAIWYHIGRRKEDFGQIWLGLSILCWSLSGGLEVCFAQMALNGMEINTALLEGGRSILSLLNSLFILLSLPWFRYTPRLLAPFIKSKHWNLIVGLPFLFSLLPTISKMVSGQSLQLMSELDVYYSVLTLGILGYVLWESFQKRRLTMLAYLSVICILITFVAQVYKLTDLQINQILLAAIFKSALIMIFFALALSWVKDLSEVLQVNPANIFIQLVKQKNEKGKFDHLVHVKGIIDNNALVLSLSPTQFSLLHLFAQRKKIALDGWLDIKPKSETRSTRTYDIKDYNEIKRLLTGLLDGLYGKDSWTKTQHEQPLRAALFD